jgi:hypothetical protein
MTTLPLNSDIALGQLEEFIITKGLTKAPEEYSDGKTQPHVQVGAAPRPDAAPRPGPSASCRVLPSCVPESSARV